MFVVNFDFSSHEFFSKLLAINIPVAITEFVTYPLQRLQTQLIKRETYYAKNQLREIPLILSEMFKVEGFPKCFHGFRYSLDYSITQMTFKFFLFDNLMITDWADRNQYALYLSCILANAVGTMASQSAFNYLTIASSFQPNRNNTTESVKQRLVRFTQRKSPFRNGLKYTLPVSIINSAAEIFLIFKLQSLFERASVLPQNDLALLETAYTKQQVGIAAIVLGLTSLTNHFAMQRQIELCFDRKTRYNYMKGLSGTVLRHVGKGLILYGLYFKYFDWLAAKEIQNQYQKKIVHNVIPAYFNFRNNN